MTSGFESAAGDSPLQISTLVGSWDMAYAREQMMTTVQELARNKQLPGFIFAQSDSLADIAADSLKSVGAAVCPSDSGSDSDLRKDTAALQTDCTAIISVGASSGNENDTNSGEISKEFSIDSNYVDGVTPLIEKILHGESVSKDTAARVDGVTQ
jgi:hypothetical protein